MSALGEEYKMKNKNVLLEIIEHDLEIVLGFFFVSLGNAWETRIKFRIILIRPVFIWDRKT